MIQNLLRRLLHSIAHFVPGGYTLRPALHRLRGVRIGKGVWISQGVYIDELHPEAVSLGNNVSIGLGTSIFTHFYWGPRRTREHAGPVIVEDDVFIGPHCVILPKVKIGRSSVITAGTTVSRDVPPGVVWAPPKAGPIATVTVPLTHENSYEDFTRGLRPFRK